MHKSKINSINWNIQNSKILEFKIISYWIKWYKKNQLLKKPKGI